MRLTGGRLFLCVVLACFGAQAALPVQMDKKQPVYLEATEVGYDQKAATVEAIGNVQIVQGDHVVFADRVTYNQDTDIVTASGHVSELEPDGNVYFTDDLVMNREVSEGVVQNFRARLKDNSLFVAREAQRVDSKTTILHQAVYSPCKVCARQDGSDTPPLWEIQAKKATIDDEAQRIYYRDAFFDVYGVPVLYTPYYSQPTPGSPSKSGLMTPEYSHDNNLGTVVKVPVFVTFGPNMDSLTDVIYTSLGPVIAPEFRHLTTEGYYEFSGALTDAQAFTDEGTIIPGKNEIRGYVAGKGDLKLDNLYSWGFDFKRATDDTFMRLYHFDYEDNLTSQLYVDRVNGRNYARLEGLSFQGLAATDNPDTTPQAIPVFDMHAESNRIWGDSRFFLDGNAYSLNRDQGDNSSRISSTVGWKLPYVTRNGQIVEFTASLRADQYSVSDVAFGAGTFDGTVARVIPEVQMQWRYPLIRAFENGSSLTLEPTINAAISPPRSQSNKIPNEDSNLLEFSDTNIFSSDRFTGYDELETGPRLNYGLRSDYEINAKTHLLFLLGQAYQENTDNDFPLGDRTDLHFSDFVGQAGLTYNKLDLSYRFRFNDEEFTNKRNDVVAHYAGKHLTFDFGYVALDDEPGIPNQQQVYGNGTVEVIKNWSLMGEARRDLESPGGGMRDAAFGLIFKNECITITTLAHHDFTHDRDIEAGSSVTVHAILKNLE